MNCLSGETLRTLLGALAETYTVLVPVQDGEHCVYHKWPINGHTMVLDKVRTASPVKGFFFKARERVAQGFEPQVPQRSDKPLCVVGVKSCDLKGFVIEDFVFAAEDDPDPFYVQSREDSLIISCDCTCAIDTCFCLALGVKPHPESHFDLNLTPLNGEFLVQVGSEKGQAVVDQHGQLFHPPNDELLAERNRLREKVVQAVEQNLLKHRVPSQAQYPGIIERNFESGVWKDEAKTCVECGACNTICPTCHCFLLCDQKSASRFARFRVWDSCLLKGFARVAGGGNPRPQLWMRLRNRFEKKFDFFPKVSGEYACTGCGRCISACPAKIDIRRVLNRLVHHG